jgi:hypothetical protein
MINPPAGSWAFTPKLEQSTRGLSLYPNEGQSTRCAGKRRFLSENLKFNFAKNREQYKFTILYCFVKRKNGFSAVFCRVTLVNLSFSFTLSNP